MHIRYMLLHAYGTGGTTRTVFNQANSLVAAGHDIEIISVLRKRDDARFPLDPRVKVTALVDQRGDARGDEEEEAGPRRGRLGFRLPERRSSAIPAGEFGSRFFTRQTEKAVIDHMQQLHDGILVTTRPALNILAARYATGGVIRVAQEHMNLSVHASDVRREIARLYERFDLLAVLTHRDREDYSALLPGVRIVRVPNAVHAIDQRHSDHSSKVVLAAGRLYAQKGFDMLVPAFGKAVEEHPDWQLRIYGQGEKRAQLRALIEKHHLYNHVFLMGHTEQLDEELAKAAFYVLSSRFEGLPMVMIEAMTHALPVVSFDCPTGPRDVITHGEDGLLVPPGDIDALAEAMGRMMEDPDLRARMGASAAKTARDYSPEVVHPEWESIFAGLLEQRG